MRVFTTLSGDRDLVSCSIFSNFVLSFFVCVAVQNDVLKLADIPFSSPIHITLYYYFHNFMKGSFMKGRNTFLYDGLCEQVSHGPP